jgi:hypothetical protein
MLSETSVCRKLNEFERKDLLLYLINQVGEVESCTKFQGIMWHVEDLLKKKGLCCGYEFKNRFMSITDSKLDEDLQTLWYMGYIHNNPKYFNKELGVHTHRIGIKDKGKLYLDVKDVKGELKKLLGKDILNEITHLVKKLNKKSENEILKNIIKRT